MRDLVGLARVRPAEDGLEAAVLEGEARKGSSVVDAGLAQLLLGERSRRSGGERSLVSGPARGVRTGLGVHESR